MIILRRHPRAHAPANDAGVTIVEVAVAAIILTLSALAVLGLVSSASRNDYRAAQTQVVNDRLQQVMEQIKQVPYKQVALLT